VPPVPPYINPPPPPAPNPDRQHKSAQINHESVARKISVPCAGPLPNMIYLAAFENQKRRLQRQISQITYNGSEKEQQLIAECNISPANAVACAINAHPLL
jgi:hypothetical protein